jgi:1-acyl-sn-glycerol-3-phosphate acyltransferase
VTVPPFHWWKTVFFLIPVVGAYTIVLGLLSLVLGLFDRRGALPHRCAQWWARLIVATSGVRIERRGAALPPADASCVFVANHVSYYDVPILFAGVPRQLRMMAKAGLGRIPFIGWHLRRSGHLLVDLQRPGASIFKKMRRLTRLGASLLIFPEGSRSLDGDVGPFKAGIFMLAIENGWPVVPISLAGARRVMPRGRLMVQPGRVALTIHDAIPTRDLSRKDARDLARRVREIVASAAAP